GGWRARVAGARGVRGAGGAAPVADGRGARRVEAALGVGALGVGARELDVDRAQPLGRLGGAAAKLDLLGPEAAKLGTELGRPGRFGPGRKGRLETSHVRGQTLDESRSDTEGARGGA